MVFSLTERRIRLTLQYDGANFYGWQRQPTVRTVQSELEAALTRLLNRVTTVVGAGRTDRGVHALGQVASALVPAQWTAEKLRRSLNAILPADLWVAAADEVDLAFHARYDAVARSYLYRVGTAEGAFSPFRRPWCWPLREPLDRGSLYEAAALLPGEHSFRAFAKAGEEERGDRCIIYRAEWEAWDDIGLVLRLTGNRFLRHMVRYLVGTMVEIGLSRRPATDFADLLTGRSGLETSPPAPPEGLFLEHVAYSMTEIETQEKIDEDIP
jgi:tRNA pseudouridine38-40 synthase